MKMVIAYIRHEAFEPIRTELLDLGFPSLCISEVKGSGRQKGITERYRGAELTNYLRPKVKLECVVASRDVQTIVDTILKHARTGAVGDGKVFVLPVEEAYRVRTGEAGEEILQAHPDAAARHGVGDERGSAAAEPRADARRLAAARASSSGCGRSTCAWSTPCSAATGSSRWPSWPPRPSAAPVAIVVPAARRRGRRRRGRPAAAARRRCGATSPTGSRTARRRCPRRGRRGADRIGRRRASAWSRCSLARRARRARRRRSSCTWRRSPALTEVAVEEAKEEVEQNLRGSFLEDLRSRPGPRPARGRAARRRGWGATCRRGAVVLCAELTTDRPRHVVATIAGEHAGRAGPAHGRPRLRAAAGGRRRRRARRRRSSRRGGWPTRLQRHGTVGAVELLRRPRRAAARDPGGRARARRPAPVGRADRRGHRDRHLPAALPRARLAPRGGALVLRGHRGADRALRRPVPHRPRRARSRPTSSRTAT